MLTEFKFQDIQGQCPYCGHEFMDFLSKEFNKSDFKDCIGFVDVDPSNYGVNHFPRENDLTIGFECPECFERSGFHVYKDWKDEYSKWIKQGKRK